MAKKKTTVKPVSADAWEQAWQTHWRKVGFTSYELNLPEMRSGKSRTQFPYPATYSRGEEGPSQTDHVRV